MAGIVDARRDLVDQEPARRCPAHEHLDREHADMAERLGDPRGDADGLRGEVVGNRAGTVRPAGCRRVDVLGDVEGAHRAVVSRARG